MVKCDDCVGNDTEEKGTLRYTTKRRGGLGLKDIKTTERNGTAESNGDEAFTEPVSEDTESKNRCCRTGLCELFFCYLAGDGDDTPRSPQMGNFIFTRH